MNASVESLMSQAVKHNTIILYKHIQDNRTYAIFSACARLLLISQLWQE